MQTFSPSSTQNLSMDRLLRPIFVCLPLPRGVDAEALLGQYHYALAGLSLQALKSVVSKLVKGIWGEDVRFCPRPPELANMVRQEERRLAARAAPLAFAGPMTKPPLFAAMQKKCAGRHVLARNVAGAAFRPKEWPAGAIYVPILGCVFAPDGNDGGAVAGWDGQTGFAEEASGGNASGVSAEKRREDLSDAWIEPSCGPAIMQGRAAA